MIEYLLFRFAYNLSKWLSFNTLYKLSDFLYLILYHVVRYRRKVVFDNLRRAFPNISNKEIEHIAKKYYRHLSDMFLQTLKYFTLDKDE